MCIAIVKPSGVRIPERDVLKVCFKNNPDGAGFAYCRNGRNYIHKGFFTFSHFWKAFTEANIKKSEAALIHFRVATHGNVDKHTCHPFLITDNYEDMRKTNIVTSNGDVMIHNGMLNFDFDDKDISDSMFLARYLSKYDLSNKTNAYMMNIALLNNNKSKMNRVGILRIDNTVEMYGFKEPWEKVDGCFFSNKSYLISFSRSYSACGYNSNYVTESDKKEKLDYNEDEIQSKKICFCHNHSNNLCDELGIYAVHTSDKDYDVYCEDCIDNIDFFNCKYCNHSYYSDRMSQIDHICVECFNNNSEFLMDCKCERCGQIGKHIVFRCAEAEKKNSIVLCDKCFQKIKPFKCSECQRWYHDYENSGIDNLCIGCYSNKKNLYSVDECVYCKKRTDLIRTSYSTVCRRCFEEKKGKTCFVCDRKYIWGDDHIGNFDLCPNCAKKNSSEIVLDNFKSFKLLNQTIRNNLAAMFNNATDEEKKSVLEVYKYNNYFSQMQENANQAYDLMNKK